MASRYEAKSLGLLMRPYAALNTHTNTQTNTHTHTHTHTGVTHTLVPSDREVLDDDDQCYSQGPVHNVSHHQQNHPILHTHREREKETHTHTSERFTATALHVCMSVCVCVCVCVLTMYMGPLHCRIQSV